MDERVQDEGSADHDTDRSVEIVRREPEEAPEGYRPADEHGDDEHRSYRERDHGFVQLRGQ